MKKLLILSLAALLAACASEGDKYGDCNGERWYSERRPIIRSNTRQPKPRKLYVYEAPKQKPQPIIVKTPAPVPPCNQVVQAPVPQPVVVPAPATPCNGCAPSVKVTKEPVEIVYKKTTTTTVYEPKTTTDVSYEKEKITTAPVVKTVTVTTTTQSAPQPAPEPTVETISYTIDSNTETAVTPDMPADEIK